MFVEHASDDTSDKSIHDDATTDSFNRVIKEGHEANENLSDSDSSDFIPNYTSHQPFYQNQLADPEVRALFDKD